MYEKFKTDFHHVSIRVWKDYEHKWYDFPYLAMDDAIQAFIDNWPTEWNNASDLTAGSSKTLAEQKKEEAKLNME